MLATSCGVAHAINSIAEATNMGELPYKTVHSVGFSHFFHGTFAIELFSISILA